MGSNGKNFEYVYHWYFMDKESVETFNKFRKMLIVDGVSSGKGLVELVEAEVKENYALVMRDRDLVSENELISLCRDLGYKTTKRSLNIYREKEVLKDDKGNDFWYTDGFSIYYDKKKTMEFIENRLNNPTSRLVSKKEPILDEGAAGISNQ